MAHIQAGPTYVKTLPLNGGGIDGIIEGTENFKIVIVTEGDKLVVITLGRGEISHLAHVFANLTNQEA